MFFFNVHTYTILRDFKAVSDYVAKKRLLTGLFTCSCSIPILCCQLSWFSFRIITLQLYVFCKTQSLSKSRTHYISWNGCTLPLWIALASRMLQFWNNRKNKKKIIWMKSRLCSYWICTQQHSVKSAFWFNLKWWGKMQLQFQPVFKHDWLHWCFPCISDGRLYQCVLVFSKDVFTWLFHFPHFSLETT